jgi:hypothetical protein
MRTDEEITRLVRAAAAKIGVNNPEKIEAFIARFLFLDKSFFFQTPSLPPLELLLHLNIRFFGIDGFNFYKRVARLQIPFTRAYVNVLNELLAKSQLQYVSELKFLADSWLSFDGLRKLNLFREVYLCGRGLSFISRLDLRSTTEQDIEDINIANDQVILQKYQAGILVPNLDMTVVRSHVKRLRCLRERITLLTTSPLPATRGAKNADYLLKEDCPLAATKLIATQETDAPVLAIKNRIKPLTYADLNNVFCIIKGVTFDSAEHVCSRHEMRQLLDQGKSHPFLRVKDDFKKVTTDDLIDLAPENFDLKLVNQRLGLTKSAYDPKLFFEDLEKSEKLMELPESLFGSPRIFQSLDARLLQDRQLWSFLRNLDAVRSLPTVIDPLNKLVDVITSTGIPTRFCQSSQFRFLDLDPRFFTCPGMFAYLQRFTAILTSEIIQILNESADKLFQKLTIHDKIVSTIEGLPSKYFKQEQCPPEVFARIPDRWLTNKDLVQLLTDWPDLITAQFILDGMKMPRTSIPDYATALKMLKLDHDRLCTVWGREKIVDVLVHYIELKTEDWQTLVAAASKHLTVPVLNEIKKDQADHQKLIVKLYRTASLQQDEAALFQMPIYILLRESAKEILAQDHPGVAALVKVREVAVAAVQNFVLQLNAYQTSLDESQKPKEELVAYRALRAATQNPLGEERPNPEAIVAIKKTITAQNDNIKPHVLKSIFTGGYIKSTLESHLAQFETQYNAATLLLNQLAADCDANESMLRVCLLDDLFFNYLFQMKEEKLLQLLDQFPKTVLHTLFHFRPKELNKLIQTEADNTDIREKKVGNWMARYKNLVSSSIVDLPRTNKTNWSPVASASAPPAPASASEPAPKEPLAPAPAFKASAVSIVAAADPVAAGLAAAAAAAKPAEAASDNNPPVDEIEPIDNKARLEAERRRALAQKPVARPRRQITDPVSVEPPRPIRKQLPRIKSGETLSHFDEADITAGLQSFRSAVNPALALEGETFKRAPLREPGLFAFIAPGALENSGKSHAENTMDRIRAVVAQNAGKICFGVFNYGIKDTTLHWVSVFIYTPLQPDAKPQIIIIDPAFEDDQKRSTVRAIEAKFRQAFPNGLIQIISELTQQHNDSDCGVCCLQNGEDLLVRDLMTIENGVMTFHRERLALDAERYQQDQERFCNDARNIRTKWEEILGTYTKIPFFTPDGINQTSENYSFKIGKELFLAARDAQKFSDSLVTRFVQDKDLICKFLIPKYADKPLKGHQDFRVFYRTFAERFKADIASFRDNLEKLKRLYIAYKRLKRAESDLEVLEVSDADLQKELETFSRVRQDQRVAFTEETLKDIFFGMIATEFAKEKIADIVREFKLFRGDNPDYTQTDEAYLAFMELPNFDYLKLVDPSFYEQFTRRLAVSESSYASRQPLARAQRVADSPPRKPAALSAKRAADPFSPRVVIEEKKHDPVAGVGNFFVSAARPSAPKGAAVAAAAVAAPDVAASAALNSVAPTPATPNLVSAPLPPKPAPAPAALKSAAAPAATGNHRPPSSAREPNFADVKRSALADLPVLMANLIKLEQNCPLTVNLPRVKSLRELAEKWLNWLQGDHDNEEVNYQLLHMIKHLYQEVIGCRQINRNLFSANEVILQWGEAYIAGAIKIPLARIAQVRSDEIIKYDNDGRVEITQRNGQPFKAQGYEFLRCRIDEKYEALKRKVPDPSRIRDYTTDEVVAPQPLS